MAGLRTWGAAAALLSIAVAMSGCGASPTTQIFDRFEKASSTEVNVPAAMSSLKTLEDKDEKHYISIINQGKQDNRNVQTLIDNTNQALAERKQVLEQMKAQLDEARDQIGEMDGIIANLKEEELKKPAEEAYQAYVKRYDTFKSLFESYEKWIEHEQSLYEQLKSEDTKLKSINKAVAERNEAYRQVEELKKQFNDYTTQFNTLKSDFYEKAGLQVKKPEQPKEDDDSVDPELEIPPIENDGSE
ncbi:YkyA family protein [Paenibacillus melissococcoides]|uniref:YkyA family protein n=1 Tax=Paenibacillus melissococcoides TaxID=2912268 RepID=A0ABM9G8L5_9BACL|nr:MULTISPECIES: YkyA family protein [Paenibacillus]MEB9896763.1 YkyA family protein [Bacillus cereus]CAH8248008.1 YkyA family protein [Paenibacillus melissococcoides]CAH8718887.1 YkyA family protein [Paenibacillus melissococcoides]CAH8719890.1 YkyA family protein [Paenibacillus melissococcoides]GIO80705.1 hypothetical protein J6TS7_43150 [Paenibacillus dendritiformis]